MSPLFVAVPNRHVTEAVMELLRAAGWHWLEPKQRQLSFVTNDDLLRVCLIKSHDIPGMIGDGIFDVGFVQRSVVIEEGKSSTVLRELPMALGRMVIGVAESSTICSVRDLAGQRLVTHNRQLARRFMSDRNIECRIMPVLGSPEVYVSVGVAEGALTYWKTGSTFRANGLRVLTEVCRSQLVIVASAAAAGRSETLHFLSRLDSYLLNREVPAHWRLA